MCVCVVCVCMYVCVHKTISEANLLFKAIGMGVIFLLEENEIFL